MRWEKAMMDTNLDGEVTALPRSGSRVRAPSPAPDFLEQPKPDEGPLCQRAFRFSQRCASMVMAAARFHAADPDAAIVNSTRKNLSRLDAKQCPYCIAASAENCFE